MYKKRREQLLKLLHKAYPHVQKGVIVLFASFESTKHLFRQESSFYYLTGVCEPGAVFCLHWDGREQLFLPAYGRKREEWVSGKVIVDRSVEVLELGQPCASYFMKPFFYEDEYENLISMLGEELGSEGYLCSLLDHSNDSYFTSVHCFENIQQHLKTSPDHVIDIARYVAALRRKKDDDELALLSRAIEITYKAHEAVEAMVKPGLYEYEVQAEIEKVFTMHHAQVAFPSIVATGKNTTVLHYTARDHKLAAGDLLVVDIGAEVEGYCADITRTYPVLGTLTPRQKEIYTLVRDVQTHIASLAKPGMFLQNKNAPEQSLHHLAVAFLESAGYDRYFAHGIGHFLGLDVHDVGDMSVPLDVGTVFTIEPGIYIAEENIGVRIEDDFVITPSGCMILGEK